MTRPKSFSGLHHLALWVIAFEKCLFFYQDILGLTIEWQPDPDNVYLTSGSDNLALHRAPQNFTPSDDQFLDHLGFIVATEAAVDEWYAYLKSQGVTIKSLPRTHRDGARSFYCCDPDNRTVQIIYHPPLAHLR